MSVKIREALEKISPYTAGQKKEGAIKLSSNENPLGPSPKALEAIERNLGNLHYYPDGFCKSLRAKLAEVYGLTAEHFIVGNGSDELMVIIAASVINPGDRGITAGNTFSEYTFSVQLLDGSMRKVPLSEGRIRLQDFLPAMDKSTRIVFLCNPNNPTGTYFSGKELERFLREVGEDTAVVLDEAYHDFVNADDFPDALSLIKRYQNLIVLRTFSKIYGLAGLRVGYAMGDPGLIQELYRAKQPFNVNVLAQKAAEAALEDRDFHKKSRELVYAEREFYYAELSRFGIRYFPSQANFVCIDTETDCRAVAKAMAEGGITVRPLTSFGLDTWIRVSIGLPEQNKNCMVLLRKILCL